MSAKIDQYGYNRLRGMLNPHPYPPDIPKNTATRQSVLEEIELQVWNSLADTYYQLLCIVELDDPTTKLRKVEDLTEDLKGKMTMLDEMRLSFNGVSQ